MAVGGQKGEVRRKTRHPSPNTSTFAVTQALVTLLTSDNWGDRLMQSLAVGNLLPGGKYYCKPGYFCLGKIRDCVTKMLRMMVIRAPPSKMWEPYSNHFVCPSVRLSVCLSVRPSVHTFFVTR